MKQFIIKQTITYRCGRNGKMIHDRISKKKYNGKGLSISIRDSGIAASKCVVSPDAVLYKVDFPISHMSTEDIISIISNMEGYPIGEALVNAHAIQKEGE